MNIPISAGRLIRGTSDEFDTTDLSNEMRALLNSEVNLWPKVVTTTNAALTSVWNDVMPQNSVGDFTLTAVGLVTGAGSVAGYRRRVVVVRAGTSAVTYLGAGVDIIGADKESVGAWDAGFALDAANPTKIYAVVLGAAATTISWRTHIKGAVYPWG